MNSNLEHLDLRSITRHSDSLQCSIDIVGRDANYRTTRFNWIICGAASIQNEERACNINARMNATDFEHDSIYAFRISLIGLKYLFTSDHGSAFEAYVNPDTDDFRIPPVGYNPEKAEGAFSCEDKECEDKHIIVPEGFYVPPLNPELFKKAAGKKLDIYIGPKWEE